MGDAAAALPPFGRSLQYVALSDLSHMTLIFPEPQLKERIPMTWRNRAACLGEDPGMFSRFGKPA